MSRFDRNTEELLGRIDGEFKAIRALARILVNGEATFTKYRDALSKLERIKERCYVALKRYDFSMDEIEEDNFKVPL